MKYVIGNWKANKNINETAKWLDEFLKMDFSWIKNQVKIIICPPLPFIYPLKEKTKDLPYIKIGSQDLSAFEEGAYTGEVTAKSLAGLCDFAIIGHSERRQHIKETDEILFKKAAMAKKYDIEPVYCIRDEKDKLPGDILFVTYEPVWAIGTGKNATLDDVLSLKQKLHLPPGKKFIYGGSVTGENVNQYLKSDEVDGVLPGGASLDPLQFYKIIASQKQD